MSESPRYTHEVGRKFYPDGAPRIFAGNTTICFVDPDGPLGRAAQAFQQALAATFGPRFALLPPSSFHMTTMELLCDEIRTPERWSAQLPLDAPIAATDPFFIERVTPLPAPAGLTMRVTSIGHRHGMLLNLEPADAATGEALWAYREAVATATGVRFPDHASYWFHISLAYRIIELDAAEEAALAEFAATWLPRLRDVGAAIALPPPTLTFFDDMCRFVTVEERHTLRTRQPAA
jgi:hypothetical protein